MDDRPLHVEAMGRPPGESTECFVLLHGFGGSSWSWRHWAPALARRGHVLLVDLKGFGSAEHPDDDAYGPGDHAALVTRLLERREAARVTLVGHSMGGGVALLVALALLERGGPSPLHRLVLVAGAAFRQRLPPFVTLARHPVLAAALLGALGPRRVVAQALRAIVYEPGALTADQIRGYAAPMERAPAASTRAMLRTALSIVPPDIDRVVARYPELDVPTLLLWGRHDPAVPLWVGERLHRVLPRSTLRILERCGHLPAEERPEESLEILDAFLDAHA